VQFTRIDARSIPSGLVHAAEQRGASTIVVGSAMGRIEYITVSSIADRLLHSSPIPVAVATRGFVRHTPVPVMAIPRAAAQELAEE
jgi:hypothetical protein